LTFNDFLWHLAPIVALLVAVFIAMCRIMFRSAFTFHPEQVEALMRLDEREAIRDVPLLIRSGIILAAVLAGFVSHSALGIEPSMVALLGAGTLVAISSMDAEDYLADVEWATLVFFMGLFVMVGALVEVGAIGTVAASATEAVEDRYFISSTVLIFASGILSCVVDNIPYVTTMSPLVAELVQAGDGSAGANAAWWALALGADLGGNATAVGASANVVVLGIAARNGHPITFWGFTKYGVLVAAVTVLIAWAYVALRYFAFA
jgi:Na+/H+ antiporter NhaD/arsenite permease-like protein